MLVIYKFQGQPFSLDLAANNRADSILGMISGSGNILRYQDETRIRTEIVRALKDFFVVGQENANPSD